MLAFRTSCSAFSRQVINKVSIVKKYSSKYFQLDDNLFGLSKDEQQLRQTIFNFVQKELAPKADKIDRDDTFPEIKEFWKKLGELGAHGITVSDQYGGTGGDYTKHAILTEEISRASASIGLSYAAQSNFFANQIQIWGNEEQKNQYLPQVCTGEKIGALAMSEPYAGSDVVGMKMTARKDGDHYVLNGTKLWITNGPIADVIIVYAKTDISKGSHGITAFIVESDMPGFSAKNIRNKVGMRGSDTGELVFEDVRVPEKNRLGEENQGVYILFKGLDSERTILAAAAIGIMNAACDVAFEYVHTRKQFDQEIGTFQLMQGKIADMYTTLLASKSLVYNVARRLDNSVISPSECAAAFLFAGENTTQVCLQALQCLGGNGYTNSYPIGRLLRDAKLYEIGGGTSEIRRMVIGRAINSRYIDKHKHTS